MRLKSMVHTAQSSAPQMGQAPRANVVSTMAQPAARGLAFRSRKSLLRCNHALTAIYGRVLQGLIARDIRRVRNARESRTRE